MMKKIIGLTLTLVMVLSLVQVPVSAAESVKISATMEGRPSDKALFHTSYTGSVKFYADAEYDISGTINRTSGKTTTTEVVRSEGNTAMELATNSAGDYVNPFLAFTAAYTLEPTDVIRFSFDFKTADKNCDKTFSFKAGSSYNDILKFLTNGNVTFNGEYVCDYDVDTWYAYDLYYDNGTKNWFIFVNGEFVKSIKYDAGIANVSVVRFLWTVPEGLTSVVTLDNIKFSSLTSEDLSAKLPKLPDFYTGFDSYTVGQSILKYSGGIYYMGDNESTAETNKIRFVNFSSGKTTVTAYQKAVGDIAAMIDIPSTETLRTYLWIEHAFDVASDGVTRFSFEFMTDKLNTLRSFVPNIRVNNATTGTDKWNFLKLNKDGTIQFIDNTISVYQANTWYDIDIYLNHSDNKFYVFINDEMKCVCDAPSDYQNITRVAYTRLWNDVGDSYGNPASKLYIDDIIIDTITTSELSGKLPATPTANAMKAVKNTVDGKLNVMVNMSAANNEFSGNLIAALYNGTELVEVLPYDAVATKYVTFTKTGDNAKIMWWSDTDSNITPKVVAIPVSFVTPAN